jgi:divalent metal cation (Fe/Co/Zn/Cd) transporter
MSIEHGSEHAAAHDHRGHDHEHQHADHHDHGGHDHEHHHDHSHGGEHGHSHGLVARSILRSRAGLHAVSWSLLVLLLTAAAQAAIFYLTGSIALLADLIHNFGDALTAIPLGIAFLMRSFLAEKRAGMFVVLTIFVSACVALAEAINRLVDPQPISNLGALAAAGIIGFAGNEIAAQVRLRAGRRLSSPALVADGYHARTDGFVSLTVVCSAIAVALGSQAADAIIGLAISLVILRITWQSFRTVQAEPGAGEFAGRAEGSSGAGVGAHTG